MKKIAIIGTGRMGSWFSANLKRECQVAVFDIEPEKTAALEGVTCLGQLEELKDFSPDLLLNAVSLAQTVKAFQAAMPFIPENCLLADIASVKAELGIYYLSCGRRFVSTHPMFGPTFADLSQLEEENAILIQESDPEGKTFFRRFYSQLGLNLFEYSFEEHDQIIAYSLALPFSSTLVFAAQLNILAVPGTTFRKHLQIARGLLSEDDDLLAEILFNPYALPQLEKITQRLEFLKHIIKERDEDEMRRFLNRVRENIKSE